MLCKNEEKSSGETNYTDQIVSRCKSCHMCLKQVMQSAMVPLRSPTEVMGEAYPT